MTSLTIGRDHPRLIIADDDRVVVSMLVTSLGYEFDVVGVASDSKQAIELASVTQPDVALIDVDMPKGGGLGAVRGILKVAPDTAIVILSGDESDESVRELIRAGAMTYRRKGVATQVLVESLAESIKAHAMERVSRSEGTSTRPSVSGQRDLAVTVHRSNNGDKMSALSTPVGRKAAAGQAAQAKRVHESSEVKPAGKKSTATKKPSEWLDADGCDVVTDATVKRDGKESGQPRVVASTPLTGWMR
jgi:DNA-binding NarL/FixJ family response regulator